MVLVCFLAWIIPGAYEPPKAAKERVTTVPSKYKLPTYFRILIHNMHGSAIAPNATTHLRLHI